MNDYTQALGVSNSFCMAGWLMIAFSQVSNDHFIYLNTYLNSVCLSRMT